MKQRIKNIFTRNLGMKIGSILFAIVIWIAIVNVDDPTITKTFTATVKIQNESVLTNSGRYYELPNGNTISFRVTGKRSIIEKLNSNNFNAVADLSDLAEDGDDCKVPVKISPNNYSGSISISSKDYYLQVTVGDILDNNYVIETQQNGTPATGCAISQIELTPQSIQIEGPEDIVSTIDRVVAPIDLDSVSTSFSTKVTPLLLDKDGNEVDTAKLELSDDFIYANVVVANVKSLPITVETSGSLPDGNMIAELSTDPLEVTVMGPLSVLNATNTITIPGDVVNLDEITEDTTRTVDITEYLPNGLSLEDANDSQVTITIRLGMPVTTTFAIPTANITFEGLADGLTATPSDTVAVISVTGASELVNALDGNTITGTVDASELKVGNHTVVVHLNLDDTLTVSSLQINVVVSGQQND